MHIPSIHVLISADFNLYTISTSIKRIYRIKRRPELNMKFTKLTNRKFTKLT